VRDSLVIAGATAALPAAAGAAASSRTFGQPPGCPSDAHAWAAPPRGQQLHRYEQHEVGDRRCGPARHYDHDHVNTTRESAVAIDQLLAPLARFAAKPRTDAELADRLAQLLGERNRLAWRAVRTIAPLHHVPTGGPWSFGSTTSFIAARSNHAAATPQKSVRHLLLRYLQGSDPPPCRTAPSSLPGAAGCAGRPAIVDRRDPPATRAGR